MPSQGRPGESASLSQEEKLEIWRTVREAAGPGKLLIAGTGVQSVRETISLTDAAAERGFDVALVLTPHYHKAQMLRPESQEAFYLKVADTAKLPILIYNFPQTTGIDLSADLIVRIAQHPNIIGVKESSTDMDKIRKLISELPNEFPVLVGGSAVFHSCLALGAAGGILAIANALPHPTALIYDLYKGGDISASREAQASIFDAAEIAPATGYKV